jgi:hypothetical protein
MLNKNVINSRLYHDYLMPSRINDYEKILENAAGLYSFQTISSFDEIIASGKLSNCKYLIIRRDVDTRAYRVLKKMLSIEQKYNVKCSYYFRKRTLNIGLAREIARAGNEVSYHYEELAQYAYFHHIKTSEEVYASMQEIRTLFERNLYEFRKLTGLECKSVASHGDFINRKLNIFNTEILKDEKFREKCGIYREAYDKEQMSFVTFRIADQGNPGFTDQAISAIQRGEPVIYLLSHPAQWGADIWANTQENVSRLFRGIIY